MLDNDRPARMRETDEDREVRAAAFGIAAEELRQFIKRIEQLEAEKRDLGEHLKEVMAEAKGRGYDPAAIRKIVKERRVKPEVREAEQAVLDLYRSVLGMA